MSSPGDLLLSPNDLSERIVVSWFKNPTTVQKQSKIKPASKMRTTIISHMNTGRKKSVKKNEQDHGRLPDLIFPPNSVAK